MRRWTHYFGIIAVFACFAAGLCFAQETDKEDEIVAKIKKMSPEERLKDATARRGTYYAKRLKTFIEETPKCEQGGVVFVGDSITEGFPLTIAFKGKNYVNRGISGDTVDGVYERLDVSVVDLKPKKLYLKIGINDINGMTSDRIPDLGRRHDRLLKAMREAAPDADFSVFSVLPVGPGFEKKKMDILNLNEMIKASAKKNNVKYIDLHPAMEDKNGMLRSEFTPDDIHLTLEGYLAWLEVITTEDEFFQCVVNLSDIWEETNSQNHEIAKVDPDPKGSMYPGARGENELVVYTPAYSKTTTGTNEYGYEAIVENGTVVKQNLRDSEIPKNGFVVSAHGKAGSWIKSNLTVGTKVEYKKDELKVTNYPEKEFTPAEKQRFVQKKIINVVFLLKSKKDADPLMAEAKDLLKKIRIIKNPDNTGAAEIINELGEKVDQLKAKAEKLEKK